MQNDELQMKHKALSRDTFYSKQTIWMHFTNWKDSEGNAHTHGL